MIFTLPGKFMPTKDFLESNPHIFSKLTPEAFDNLNIEETVKVASAIQLADLAALLGPSTMFKDAKAICTPFFQKIQASPDDIKALSLEVIARLPSACIQNDDVINAMKIEQIRALGASLNYCESSCMLGREKFRTNMARGQLTLLFSHKGSVDLEECNKNLNFEILNNMSSEGMADITPLCRSKIKDYAKITANRLALMINADVHRSVSMPMPDAWHYGLRSGQVKDFDIDNKAKPEYCKRFRFDLIKPYHADVIDPVCFKNAIENHPKTSPDLIMLEAEFYTSALESLFDDITLESIDRFKDFWTLALPKQVISLVNKHKETACKGFKLAHTRSQPAKIISAMTEGEIKALPLACVNDASVIQDIGARIDKLPHLNSVNVQHVMDCKECVEKITKAGLEKLIDNNADRCKSISAENLNSMGTGALIAVFKECFWNVKNVRRDLDSMRLVVFPDNIFREVAEELPVKWYENLSPDLLKTFDSSRTVDEKCKHLRLDKVSYGIDAQCFYNAIKSNTAVRKLDAPLAKANPGLFSHFGDHLLLRRIAKDSPFWENLQEQHVEAILNLIKDKDLDDIWNVLTDGFCTGFKKVHTDITVDLIRKRDMDELQKPPVTCFTSSHVLERLGKTRIAQLGRSLQDPQAGKLFEEALFKKHSTATQFEAIFSADNYAKCAELDASHLDGVNAAVLGAIDFNCINQIRWNFADIGNARKVVPFLSPTAFSAIDHKINNNFVFNLLSGAQIESFGKIHGERRGQFLDLEHIQPYLAKHVDGVLFVNALQAAPTLTRAFFKHLDPKAMAAVKDKHVIDDLIKSGNVLLEMTTEQLDTLLKADHSLCYKLGAPPLGALVNLPPIKTSCFGLMEASVQVDFLSRSELLAKLEDDALSALSPKAPELLPKLRLIGILRPKMLSFLGAKEGDNPCSAFTLKNAATIGKALTLLPLQCLRSFVGLHKLTIRNIQTLPAALFAAVDLSEMLANSAPFLKSVRKDDWKKLTDQGKFCAALTVDTLKLVNPSINALDVSAACFSELPLELLPQEQLAKAPTKTIVEASPAAIGRLKHLTPEHAGALDKNTSGITNASVLTEPALKAMSATAIGSLQPATFGKLDETQLPAIKPSSLELVTKAHVSLLRRNALQALSVEQVDHIGKQIKDPEQDPRTFLQRPEVLEALRPEVQSRLVAASSA